MMNTTLRLALFGLLLWMPLACSEASEDAEPATEPSESEAQPPASEAQPSESEAQPSESEALEIDTTEQRFDADDERIQFMGRIDWSDPKIAVVSAGGASMSARFLGDAVTVVIADKGQNGPNYFDAYVDGEFVTKIEPIVGKKSYEIATDLEPGEHTVTVSKRTEASIGKTHFEGFKIGGTLLDPPDPPEHKIEFIGDSITAGGGVEAVRDSAQCSEGGWGQAYMNANASFAAVAGRALEAEFNIIGVSGIGLMYNYNSENLRTMRDVYELTFVESEDSEEWDRSRFIPDAVVVALGTNDFSPGDSERPPLDVEPYQEEYIAFVERLRGYYPNADIFVISSTMLGDGWPDETYTSSTSLITVVTETARHFNEAGDDKVHAALQTRLGGAGCGTHPNVEQQARLGNELADEIRTALGW
jgi:lysophospholipase L1-like esterase